MKRYEPDKTEKVLIKTGAYQQIGEDAPVWLY